MLINAALLREHAACADQVATFEAAFPDGLAVQGEPDANAIAAIVAAKLDIDWAARFLGAPARAEYYRVTAPAWA